ncbi:CCC motif membrane protein [uncultured Maribacter sp.]|uniref:CCC motif membrane protein n=1 Tax=uncultured Maribacter sp. TaxID=431308 RepID=UPI0026142389|nr:CCC motif membrane protein [uncultured Maribacter sp.]
MHKNKLPGASTSLTMGIVSLVTSLCCCGPFAAIFSIIGIINANKATRIYNENPSEYEGYENAKTGKILSYIGLAFAVFALIIVIAYFGIIAAIIANGDWERINDI